MKKTEPKFKKGDKVLYSNYQHKRTIADEPTWNGVTWMYELEGGEFVRCGEEYLKEDKSAGAHTQGEWFTSIDINKNAIAVHSGDKYNPIAIIGNDKEYTQQEQEANARLIGDAGSTANKTGKLPSQLAEENAKMLEALKKAEEALTYANPQAHTPEAIERHKQALEIVKEQIKAAKE